MPADRKFFSDITPEGVIHYPHLDAPDSVGKFADGKYKATLAILREGTDFSKLMALVVSAAKQEWGDDVDLASVRKPFINGDNELRSDGTPDPFCVGRVLLRMKSQNKPLVVGVDRKALSPADPPVHPGDFAIANVTACAYVQGGTKGVSFWLSALMITRRGDRIGGASAAKLFAEVPEVKVAPDGVRSDDPRYYQTRLSDVPRASLDTPTGIVKRTIVHAAKPDAAAPSDLSIF